MQNDIIIKRLNILDIYPEILQNFNHKQHISAKWVKTANGWELKQANEIREWDNEKRLWIPQYLCEQIARGGFAIGAFYGNKIIGFACIDGTLKGNANKYANLTMLFVDDKWKRKGIGKELFKQICWCAASMHADKIFISAIPSYETISFYFHMGCIDAEEIINDFIDTENDRYLEYNI